MNKFKLFLSVFLILNLQVKCVKRKHEDYLKYLIFSSAKDGDTEGIRGALRQGIDIDVTNEYQDTPLIEAIINGREEAVKLLVENGANKDHKTESDFTPLMEAIGKEKIEIAKYLIEQGADIHYKNEDRKRHV